MKSKKTIRRLRSPLAKECARTAKALQVLAKRMDSMADKVEDLDHDYRMAKKEVNALHTGEMMPQQLALESALRVRKHLDSLPAEKIQRLTFEEDAVEGQEDQPC